MIEQQQPITEGELKAPTVAEAAVANRRRVSGGQE